MDLSSLNTAFNKLAKKIQDYLDNPVKFEYADFEKQRDIIFISNQYNQIVCDFSNLLNLITEIQYFISQCKKIISLLSDNTNLEKGQKLKIKSAIDLITDLSFPLYNEKERLKTLEMFYRNLYTQRNY